MDKLFAGPAARLAGCWLLLVVAAAVVGPALVPAPWREPSLEQLRAPSLAHWCGTDVNGRDVLHRVVEGGRVSLVVGVAGALVSLVIGTGYGLVAGYVGGRLDGALMRLVEVLYAIPRLVIILVLVNTFDAGVKGWMAAAGLAAWIGYSRLAIMVVALGLIEWLTMARIVRGQVLALREQQFVMAARALGQSRVRIMLRHILPNLAGIVVTYVTLTVPAVILDESFLSFLGLGIQAPQASWGTLLSDGAQAINPVRSNWWLLLFPAAAMSLTLLALNFLGDSLRDALDPRGRR